MSNSNNPFNFFAKAPLSNAGQEFNEYVTDSMQRSVLFLDIMRQRGNEMVEMTGNNSSTVLNFKFEKIMDGGSFKRPINYWLARVLAPDGTQTDPLKRPYVIQDPRAGQGPGIGGFKKDSEIGDALKNGHPVYFVGFNAAPLPGQTYEDIIHGQVQFYEKVAELHPKSPKLCAIGNCAAGYLTMFSAMQRPDIFGPILIAGSPLSYWNGERGKNPMRYAGGLVGGSWVNSLLGDLGAGKFDGTYLILNFDLLNIANFLWGKQYSLYANIDQDGERYLQFEKWWGDFIQFNTPEIKWLVDKLFVGNQLTTGQLTTEDGIRLDPRLITSPLITFVSDGDNISPPAQSAGWIADLYSDVEEIRARGKTIIYCLNHKVGHLAIFTATKVGKREDEMFVENMETIAMLPPGLYELILETPEGQEGNGKLSSRYEPRTIDDIKRLGYNNEEDDRAFATVAKASQALDFAYNSFVHPIIKNLVTPQLADVTRALRPLRLSYTMFAERYNPWLKLLTNLQPASERKPINKENRFWQLQEEWANYTNTYLSNFQQMNDNIQEQLFFGIWGSPLVQQFWGTAATKPRYTPGSTATSAKKAAFAEELALAVKHHLPVKDKVEALCRVVALIMSQKNSISEKMAEAIHLLAEDYATDRERGKLHDIIKYQFMVVQASYPDALAALKKYRQSRIDRDDMLALARDISQHMGQMDVATQELLKNLAQELEISEESVAFSTPVAVDAGKALESAKALEPTKGRKPAGTKKKVISEE